MKTYADQRESEWLRLQSWMRSAAIEEFSNTAAVAEVSEIGREVPAGADSSIQVPFWHKADIPRPSVNCPLSAESGHAATAGGVSIRRE